MKTCIYNFLNKTRLVLATYRNLNIMIIGSNLLEKVVVGFDLTHLTGTFYKVLRYILSAEVGFQIFFCKSEEISPLLY